MIRLNQLMSNMQNKTVIESRAEELAKLRYSEDEWPRFSEQYQIVFKEGFKAALELPEVKEFIARMRQLSMATPPNAISMNIGKALSSFDKLFEVGNGN